MSVFRNTVFLAVIAGLFAGIVMAGLQGMFTVPLILAAEAYEQTGAPAPDHDHGQEVAASDHHHGEDAWMPADGAERTVYTVLVNIVTAIGFALVLVAASEAAGGIAGWRQGLLWGLSGFAVFTLAPGLGLPPELPGMPAADLLARQAWWIATVCATAAGLALIVFGRRALLAVAGVALIVAPHALGAPQPASHETAVPAALHHDFVVAVTLTNLVFWLVLGAAVGVARARFAEAMDAPQSHLA
ncbi:CbtA family protein [Chelativorans intermedius]|uniref:CbtA family protein n=1 Tax=Chelativorans intermedius TaxID=515947 RepID=A0ABV6DDD9_9HYPH|nr:CbtA family protein [Chelativorans intermedius]MCT8997085.1 CbtA family protein [Chelativorans intermedius]